MKESALFIVKVAVAIVLAGLLGGLVRRFLPAAAPTVA